MTTAGHRPSSCGDPSAGPAWSAADLRDDPHARADKAERVRDMFAAIAPRYDLNNRLHSLGRDQAWRRAAVKMAELQPGDRVLDVACGTGDLTLAFRHALFEKHSRFTFSFSPKLKLKHDQGVHHVIGLDFTFPMLPLAVKKSQIFPGWDDQPGDDENGGNTTFYVNADAMALPFADASFNVVSIAFGLRNVADHEAAMREFRRVLRPGGRLIVLEFTEPSNPLIRGVDRFYRHRVMPVTASWIARDRSGAYRYLPKSVATFLDRDGMHALYTRHGFGEVRSKSLTFGIAACYAGRA